MSLHWASLVAHWVKNTPGMQESQVWSLGQEDPWRSKQQPTPVFLPGEFHGHRSLADYSPWGCKVGQDWATFTFTFPGMIMMMVPTSVICEISARPCDRYLMDITAYNCHRKTIIVILMLEMKTLMSKMFSDFPNDTEWVSVRDRI